MPPHQWSAAEDPDMIVVRACTSFKELDLARWAIRTAESLSYLADIDTTVAAPKSPTVDGHRRTVVDTAHARWAAGSAITALDLCAALLARRSGLPPKKVPAHEYDLRDLSSQRQTPRAPFRLLQSAHQQWVRPIEADSDFVVIDAARDPFTHQVLGQFQSVTLEVGKEAWQGLSRLSFYLDGQALEAGEIVAKAARLTIRSVELLLVGVRDGVI